MSILEAPQLIVGEHVDKNSVFATVQAYLGELSLSTVSVDAERPWGGFFVIDESQTDSFAATFFPDYPMEEVHKGGKLSPKILLVEPGKRLSWQYHDRREELWLVITGPVGVNTSLTDEPSETITRGSGEIIQFPAFARHRLIGLDNWGIVAEIWQHTDPDNPSDENDITRVSDDFGR